MPFTLGNLTTDQVSECKRHRFGFGCRALRADILHSKTLRSKVKSSPACRNGRSGCPLLAFATQKPYVVLGARRGLEQAPRPEGRPELLLGPDCRNGRSGCTPFWLLRSKSQKGVQGLAFATQKFGVFATLALRLPCSA